MFEDQRAHGLHPITIRYDDGFGLQDLDIRWARGNHPTDQIPRLFLVPQLVAGEEAQSRVRIQTLTSSLPLIWSVILVGVIAVQIVRRCTFPERLDRRVALEMIPIYIAAVVLFASGISWGLPDDRGWAVDEITPGQVQDILEHRFSREWATTYPPLHFGLLSVVSMPVYGARAIGVMDDTLKTYSELFIVGRALSVGMGLCILAFLYRLTLDEFGHRAARFAVIATLTILPLTYYAKTANLDVPYLFWLTASCREARRCAAAGSNS